MTGQERGRYVTYRGINNLPADAPTDWSELWAWNCGANHHDLITHKEKAWIWAINPDGSKVRVSCRWCKDGLRRAEVKRQSEAFRSSYKQEQYLRRVSAQREYEEMMQLVLNPPPPKVYPPRIVPQKKGDAT